MSHDTLELSFWLFWTVWGVSNVKFAISIICMFMESKSFLRRLWGLRFPWALVTTVVNIWLLLRCVCFEAKQKSDLLLNTMLFCSRQFLLPAWCCHRDYVPLITCYGGDDLILKFGLQSGIYINTAQNELNWTTCWTSESPHSSFNVKQQNQHQWFVVKPTTNHPITNTINSLCIYFWSF